MQLICHMTQKVFSVASTLFSWLSLDYRFVVVLVGFSYLLSLAYIGILMSKLILRKLI